MNLKAIAAPGWAILVMALLPAVSVAQGEVLTNEDILNLTQAGLPAEVVVAKIESTKTAFDTSVEQLVALVQAGVHADVLAAMAQAVSSAGAVEEQPGDAPLRAEERRSEPSRSAKPLPADPQPVTRTSWEPGATFSDALSSGGRGPDMVVIRAGRFFMGCVSGMGCRNEERPIRDVAFGQPFAVSKYEVTLDEYDRFTAATGRPPVDDKDWGRGRRPVLNVSWSEALEYVVWLSLETGANYRLPSEAEWEYAARAGSTWQFHFGDYTSSLCRYGNHADASLPERIEWRNLACSDGVGLKTAEVGQYEANPWGLHDIHGNVWEWVEDCWNDSYTGAPTDGAVWLTGDCTRRVLRGGSWGNRPALLRAAHRSSVDAGERGVNVGFRVARTLVP